MPRVRNPLGIQPFPLQYIRRYVSRNCPEANTLERIVVWQLSKRNSSSVGGSGQIVIKRINIKRINIDNADEIGI
jgi:hypothetical protein